MGYQTIYSKRSGNPVLATVGKGFLLIGLLVVFTGAGTFDHGGDMVLSIVLAFLGLAIFILGVFMVRANDDFLD